MSISQVRIAVHGMMLIAIMIVGTAGTMLFIRGLAGLLSAAAASVKRSTTHGLYVFTLRQLHENVVHKYISIGVASILFILTIMFIADGSTRIMSSQMTRESSVYDFTVTGDEATIEKCLSSEQMKPYVADLSRMEIGDMKRPASGEMNSLTDWAGLREQVVLNLPSDVKDPDMQGATGYELGANQPAALNLLGYIDTMGTAPCLIPVSSYNELLETAGEKTIALSGNEAVFYLNPDFLESTQEEICAMLDQILEKAQRNGTPLLSVDGQSITLIPSVPMKGLTADSSVTIKTALIVTDELYSEYVNPDTVTVYHNFCICGKN